MDRVRVTNSTDLASAVVDAESADLHIVIAGRAQFPSGGIRQSSNSHELWISGEPTTDPTQKPVLDMSAMLWPGWVGDVGSQSAPATQPNGLELNCGKLSVRNLTITGYNNSGTALKANADDTINLYNLDFLSIGDVMWPYKDATAPSSSADTVYNNAFASHANPGNVTVDLCRFYRCGLSEWTYSHPVYCSSPVNTVKRCTFYQCNNLSVGYPGTHSDRDVVINNLFINPAASPVTAQYSPSARRLPYVHTINSHDLLLRGNRHIGSFYYLGTGAPNRVGTTQVIRGNRYDEATFLVAFFSETGVGLIANLAAWQARGNDTNFVS